MFTAWGWDKDKNFKSRVTSQMRKFADCNATLFGRTDLLNALPDDELFAYMGKCFRGMAMEYVTNSLYPICIAGALRIFKREQVGAAQRSGAFGSCRARGGSGKGGVEARGRGCAPSQSVCAAC